MLLALARERTNNNNNNSPRRRRKKQQHTMSWESGKKREEKYHRQNNVIRAYTCICMRTFNEFNFFLMTNDALWMCVCVCRCVYMLNRSQCCFCSISFFSSFRLLYNRLRVVCVCVYLSCFFFHSILVALTVVATSKEINFNDIYFGFRIHFFFLLLFRFVSISLCPLVGGGVNYSILCIYISIILVIN